MLILKKNLWLDFLLEAGIFLVVVLLPLYLLRLQIGWMPTNVLELAIAILFALWLIKKTFQKQNFFQFFKSPNFWLWAWPIGLIFIGLSLSTLFSSDLLVSAGIWKGWFFVPLLFLIVLVETVKTKKQVTSIFIALALSGAVVGLISLWYWLSGNLTYDGRLSSFYLSPNHLAMYLAPILILSNYLYFLSKKKYLKNILLGLALLWLLVLYLTYSYSAWLAVALALVFLGLVSWRRHAPKKVLALLLLLMLSLSFWQLSSQKFQDLLYSSRSSWQSRIMVWRSAGQIIKDHPVIGIGPGLFQKYYLDYQSRFEPYLEWAVPQPHNIWLAFWLQAGLIGLLGFIWLLAVFFKTASKNLSACSIVLSAAMIYILLHGLVDTPYWKNDLSVIFWLIIGLMIIQSASPTTRTHPNNRQMEQYVDDR